MRGLTDRDGEKHPKYTDFGPQRQLEADDLDINGMIALLTAVTAPCECEPGGYSRWGERNKNYKPLICAKVPMDRSWFTWFADAARR